ncbi:hypothetical protein HDU85_001867 [Gaertneriomyces sp. JEL0708]|nr:hypothetical protein HDU85_001867 [Gaertneriomyces sp. JEL0708]
MKLDARLIQYLSPDHYRVLTAAEMGSRNHEVVPTSLIAHIAKRRTGGLPKLIAELAKNNLLARVQNIKYDGYRLTYGGYDYLALRTLCKQGALSSVGNQIGVGKESDIYIVADDEQEQRVLKIHRLGRTSFRSIKSKRDYLRNRNAGSWLYFSRLAAAKEFAFMQILHENGFPVPTPIANNRHCVIMSLVKNAYPLYQIREVENPGKLYETLMSLIVRLAEAGLIHGDFNEFNLMLSDDDVPILIDFPQMVSTSHANAEMYFDRDVECVKTFFKKRFHFEATSWPEFGDIERKGDLDVQAAASGFTKKQLEELHEQFHDENKDEPSSETEEETDSEDEEDDVVPGDADTEANANDVTRDPVSGETHGVDASLGALSLNDSLEDACESSEASDDEPEDLKADRPQNNAFLPFRDVNNRFSTTSSQASVSNTQRSTVSAAETIQSRVRRTIKDKATGAKGSSASKGNRSKGRGIRDAKNAVKSYGGGGGMWD